MAEPINKQLHKLLNAMVEVYPLAKFRHRYVDYKDGVWTVPCDLKHHRIDSILTDHSVDKIQVKRTPESDWETFDPHVPKQKLNTN